MVDQPAAVFVSEISGKHWIVMELNVAPQDFGKIIGKGGRTADACQRSFDQA